MPPCHPLYPLNNATQPTGRWTSADPLMFVDGPNLYVAYFVPNGVDPSGMEGFWGGFGSSLWRGAGSMQNAFGAMYADTMCACGYGEYGQVSSELWRQSYSDGILGQTQNSSGFTYYGTRGALGVATVAAGTAVIVGGVEYIILDNGSVLVEGRILGHPISKGGIMQLRPEGQAPWIRLDYHAFKKGCTKVLHLDFNQLGISHWPWK